MSKFHPTAEINRSPPLNMLNVSCEFTSTPQFKQPEFETFKEPTCHVNNLSQEQTIAFQAEYAELCKKRAKLDSLKIECSMICEKSMNSVYKLCAAKMKSLGEYEEKMAIEHLESLQMPITAVEDEIESAIIILHNNLACPIANLHDGNFASIHRAYKQMDQFMAVNEMINVEKLNDQLEKSLNAPVLSRICGKYQNFNNEIMADFANLATKFDQQHGHQHQLLNHFSVPTTTTVNLPRIRILTPPPQPPRLLEDYSPRVTFPTTASVAVSTTNKLNDSEKTSNSAIEINQCSAINVAVTLAETCDTVDCEASTSATPDVVSESPEVQSVNASPESSGSINRETVSPAAVVDTAHDEVVKRVAPDISVLISLADQVAMKNFRRWLDSVDCHSGAKEKSKDKTKRKRPSGDDELNNAEFFKRGKTATSNAPSDLTNVIAKLKSKGCTKQPKTTQLLVPSDGGFLAAMTAPTAVQRVQAVLASRSGSRSENDSRVAKRPNILPASKVQKPIGVKVPTTASNFPENTPVVPQETLCAAPPVSLNCKNSAPAASNLPCTSSTTVNPSTVPIDVGQREVPRSILRKPKINIHPSCSTTTDNIGSPLTRPCDRTASNQSSTAQTTQRSTVTKDVANTDLIDAHKVTEEIRNDADQVANAALLQELQELREYKKQQQDIEKENERQTMIQLLAIAAQANSKSNGQAQLQPKAETPPQLPETVVGASQVDAQIRLNNQACSSSASTSSTTTTSPLLLEKFQPVPERPQLTVLPPASNRIGNTPASTISFAIKKKPSLTLAAKSRIALEAAKIASAKSADKIPKNNNFTGRPEHWSRGRNVFGRSPSPDKPSQSFYHRNRSSHSRPY